MKVNKLLTFGLLPLLSISNVYADFFDADKEFNDLKSEVQRNISSFDKDFSKYGYNYNEERSSSHHSYEERTKSSSSSAKINTDSLLENVGEYVTGLIILDMLDKSIDDRIERKVEEASRHQFEALNKNNEAKIINNEQNESFDNIFESDDHIFTDDSSIFN